MNNLTPIPGMNSNTYTISSQTWDASASSQQVVSQLYGEAYKAFDASMTTFWTCSPSRYSNGVYIGSNITNVIGVGTISGEWLQMKFPSQFALEEYTMKVRSGNTMVRMPRVFYIAGSNDGTNWFPVDSKNYQDNGTGLDTLTNTISSIPKYSYYRLVINSVYSSVLYGDYTELLEWEMKISGFSGNSLYIANSIGQDIFSGAIIAYYGVNDPDGWIILNGIVRTNGGDGRYNNLVNLGIGTIVGNNYTPPNLNAAFLRGIGSSDVFNGVTYTGPTSARQLQYHATKTHTHTATQDSHTHTPVITLNSVEYQVNGASTNGTALNPKAGLWMNDSQYTAQGFDFNATELELKGTLDALTINDATPAITVNSSTGGNEVRPFNFGINWIIKL